MKRHGTYKVTELNAECFQVHLAKAFEMYLETFQ